MRIFIENEYKVGQVFDICGGDAHHISRVMRMRPGDTVEVVSTGSVLHKCTLTDVQKESITLTVTSVCTEKNEPTIKVTLYAGLSKGDRFDYLIQKAVECGANHIVPFVSSRCIARPEKADFEKKRLRFEKIALEASRQAKRSKAVTVGDIVQFNEALLQASSADISLFLYEAESNTSLSSAISHERAYNFAIVSGPEGGFSESEAQMARQAGLSSVSIGRRILRCETAPIAALCAIMFQTGNFDI